MITFGVTSLLMIMKFYFITYNPIKIGIKNTFRLQIKAAKRHIKYESVCICR